MYRNYFGRGTEQNPSDNRTGTGVNSSSVTSSTVSSQHQEPKYSASGSSQFVPSLTAITSNQNLQWLVQPSVFSMPGPSRAPPLPTYHHLPPRLGSVNLQSAQTHLLQTATGLGSTTSRKPDKHLSPEEQERRRIRRERNKRAAAKCRNRRRELTDSLQNETDNLEDKKSRLQKEIADLQKEKEKLELVLEAHRPICKVGDSDSDSDSQTVMPVLGGIKIEPVDCELPGPSRGRKMLSKPEKPKPKITIPPPPTTSAAGNINLESDTLHTPILISTPSLTPFTASLVFTYPTTSPVLSQPPSLTAPSTSQHSISQPSRNPEPCGIAHRRSSSSGDQSDQSLNSPTILTL